MCRVKLQTGIAHDTTVEKQPHLPTTLEAHQYVDPMEYV